jgi:predicted esterase
MAASLLLTHPELFGAAILFRAMMPFEPEALPDLHGKPVYLAAGRRDPLIVPQLVTRLSAVLEEAGAQVVLRWQDAGHGLGPGEIAEARAWLDTVVKAGSREGESSAAQSEE